MCLSVGLSVRRVYCGETADWICMSFRVVSGVIGRGMGFLDGGKRGASQRGLCGVVILDCEGWRRGSSQIILGFFVSFLTACCSI